jgi:hypothetical protein
MERKTKLMIATGIAAAAVAGGAGLALAGGGTDADRPLAGSDLSRATEAALAHTGGGTVVETEVGDDGAAYGVEILLADGSVVEVDLDARYEVIRSTPDEDRPGEVDGAEAEASETG